MKSFIFEVYVLSMDGCRKSFIDYIKIKEDDAIVISGKVKYISEDGWKEISKLVGNPSLTFDNKHEQSKYHIRYMSLEDRINIVSSIDYQIEELTKQRDMLALSADEALQYKRGLKERFFFDILSQ